MDQQQQQQSKTSQQQRNTLRRIWLELNILNQTTGNRQFENVSLTISLHNEAQTQFWKISIHNTGIFSMNNTQYSIYRDPTHRRGVNISISKENRKNLISLFSYEERIHNITTQTWIFRLLKKIMDNGFKISESKFMSGSAIYARPPIIQGAPEIGQLPEENSWKRIPHRIKGHVSLQLSAIIKTQPRSPTNPNTLTRQQQRQQQQQAYEQR